MRMPNPRRIKLNFSYLVHEIAKACRVTRGTVRRWRKEGLVPIEERKPWLFLGIEVRHFLERKRRSRKHPCGPGKIFCMRCHCPKEPLGNEVDYRPRDAVVGTLIGLCPDCRCSMYRHINLERLPLVRGELTVRMTE